MTRSGHSPPNTPTVVEHAAHRFLIFDSPTDADIDSYVEMLRSHKVVAVVRTCEPTYSPQPVLDAGMRFLDLPFVDGEPPPEEVVNQWVGLVDQVFGAGPTATAAGSTLAVHCSAGLGRSPALVAIALVEAGMDPLDAIELVRKKRRGAINSKQLKFIEAYRRHSGSGTCCVLL